MEHHSSYSAPRSSRASGRTRSTASRQDQRRTHKPQKNGNTGFSRILLCYSADRHDTHIKISNSQRL